MRCLLTVFALVGPTACYAAPLDHAKPLLTSQGSPLCDTKADLKNLLEHVRAGVKGIRNGDYGCIAAMDGWDVRVIESDGALDRWDRVNTEWAHGTRDFWTADWTLRN